MLLSVTKREMDLQKNVCRRSHFKWNVLLFGTRSLPEYFSAVSMNASRTARFTQCLCMGTVGGSLTRSLTICSASFFSCGSVKKLFAPGLALRCALILTKIRILMHILKLCELGVLLSSVQVAGPHFPCGIRQLRGRNAPGSVCGERNSIITIEGFRRIHLALWRSLLVRS